MTPIILGIIFSKCLFLMGDLYAIDTLYDYGRHFGGVYYLFLRGMDPSRAGNGVFFDRPSQQLIEAADALLMGDR